VVCADDVNVREKPDLKSTTIASLQQGDRVYLVSISGPWYYVSIPAKKAKGFVFGSFLAQLKEVVIAADQVNLRQAPKSNAKVLAKLPKGARFVRLGESGKYHFADQRLRRLGQQGPVPAIAGGASPLQSGRQPGELPPDPQR
jgi:uncharacterized protein YgiM (DUF1202 family)